MNKKDKIEIEGKNTYKRDVEIGKRPEVRESNNEDQLIAKMFRSMNEIKYLKIDKTLPDLVSSKDNIGIDLYARTDGKLMPEYSCLIPLNVVLQGNYDLAYFLFPRSSLFTSKGLILLNSIGVIDPSYEGPNDEIKALVKNVTKEERSWKKGERLFQLVVLPRIMVNMVKEEKHWESKDRNGFGSTGL